MLTLSLADCTDEACAVEIGKLLAAEQIVLGTAGRIGQRYYLAVKLIDVAKGTNIATENEQKPSLDEIVDTLVGLAGRLAGLNDAQPPRATVATSPSPSPASVAAPKPTNSLVDMVLVQGGTFQMGSMGVAAPVHTVTVSSFLVAKSEVTQAQYQTVMGSNPSSFTSGADAPDRPVEQVSWLDAVDFCNRLSAKEGLQPCYTISATSVSCDFSMSGYRLPTEAE